MTPSQRPSAAIVDVDRDMAPRCTSASCGLLLGGTRRWPRWMTAADVLPSPAGVFPELIEDENLEWSPRWLLVSGDPRPNYGVDVTGPDAAAYTD